MHTKKTAYTFRCLFCGTRLVRGADAKTLSCKKCGAVFGVRRNQRRCVTGVVIRDCGAWSWQKGRRYYESQGA